MEAEAISLYELNALVHDVVSVSFTRQYWITAELSQVRVAATGHCYVEFVDRHPRRDTLRAKASGNIWRDVYALIVPRFERETGQTLRAGLKVRVCVGVTFHECYGFSLNVTDIDASYTLGDRERRRREIMAQLTEDGVVDLNRQLTLPRVCRRIAVVSSDTAAGYGDFCRQIEQSGYDFELKLFPAVMQGERVEESLLAALERIVAEYEKWDAVAIIRGGGAVSDLDGFDTYLCAAAVAQFPLPVLTGIGHERDNTLVDLVAAMRLKTPTAVAAFLVERRRNEVEAVDSLDRRLAQAAQLMQLRQMHRCQHVARHMQSAFATATAREKEKIITLCGVMDYGRRNFFERKHAMIERQYARIDVAARHELKRANFALDAAQRALKMAGPERILRMGFSITMKNGRPIRSVEEIKPGDTIVTRLERGTATSVVDSVTECKKRE